MGKLNGAAPIFPMSATKGEGVDAWAEWLVGAHRRGEGGVGRSRRGLTPTRPEGVTVDRDSAYALVVERIPNRNLVNHCVATEVIMDALAERLDVARRTASAGRSPGSSTTWTTPRPARTPPGTDS